MTAVRPAETNAATGLFRGGLVGFLGSATSAGMGFVLTVVLAQTLGQSGAGLVLQVIGIVSIALGFAKLGMDSVVIWLLPRLAVSEPARVRGALTLSLLIAGGAGLLGSAALVAAASTLGHGAAGSALADAVRAVAWFLPAGTVLLVALAATRALGGMWAYSVIGGLGLPTMRVATVAMLALLGGSAVAASIGWAALLVPAALTALFVLALQHRRRFGALEAATRLPDRSLSRRMWRYAVPRTASAGLEQGLVWLDVLVVGLILGSAAAGVYGAAGRFIAAGLIVDTAIRMVIGPRLSVLLAQRRTRDAETLYSTATTWMLLFSTPIYLTLLAFGPVILGWLGPGFASGAAALAVLSVGAIATLSFGPVHTVLLMSGRSGWAAANKAVVLAANVVGNILLVPHLGILGAAISWAGCMLLDAGLAAVQVRVFLGIRLHAPTVARAVAIPVLAVGIPAIATQLLLGASPVALLLTVLVGGAALIAWCARDASRLGLDDLRSRRRSAGTSELEHP